MARNKKTRPEWFKFWRRNRQQLDSELLSMESRGRIFTNMMRYFDEGDAADLVEMSPLESYAFNGLKTNIDDAFADWKETSEKATENINKRWHPDNCDTTVYDGIPQYTDDTEDRSKKKEERRQRTEEIRQNTRKRENIFSDFAGEDAELLEALRSFEEMRKKIKKPLSDRAKEITLSKLQTFQRNQWIPILEQSVFNSWQGLFPLKTEKQTDNIFLQILEEEAAK